MSVKKIANKIGVDKAIAYSSGSNILAAIASILTLYLIGTCLSPEEQGYYYTFGSILAMQTFFDLGLTGIMTQYVAHEQAHLEWDAEGIALHGEAKYKSRLSSLLHFCVKWYMIVSIAMLLALIVIGFIFFNSYGHKTGIEWKTPWVLVCIGTALNLFLSPILSFYSGLGKIKEVSRIFFYKQIIIPFITWIGLILGLALYVSGISTICTAIFVFIYIAATKFRPILTNIWETNICERVCYMKEIFPYQWKIALSWISGYFIYQLFNPVLFATDGAVIAGQMGMTLSVLNAINGLSMNWINTKVPLFSVLIERCQFKELDSVFGKTLKQESFVCFLLLLVFIMGVYMLKIFTIGFHGHLLSNRFLPILSIIIMSLSVFANQFVSSFAVYLRCHKKEPFLKNSVVMGILCMLSTMFLGKSFGLYGICVGYCFLQVCISLPWGYNIFKTKKQEWHQPILV